MDILSKLFGSAAKVKLMRLFLFNPETAYTTKEITNRAKISTREAQKELATLISFGIVRIKPVRREINVRRRKKIVVKKIEEKGYTLNPKFAYLTALKSLLTSASVHADESLTQKFAKIGKVKVLIATGVFLQRWDSRVDLLIVADEMSTVRLEKAIASLEAEIGKEISYSAFDTEDFEYRLGIHDRLIRDILDFQHTVLVDRLGIEGK
ncbi:MAG: hypothetical protein WCQ60_01555 [bacterium]